MAEFSDVQLTTHLGTGGKENEMQHERSVGCVLCINGLLHTT